MGILDRILGTSARRRASAPHRGGLALSEDARALERYRYMLQTAPPGTLEEAHAEAFERLTPEQRRLILAELTQATPASERAEVQGISSDDPRAMARLATRAEVRQPGFLERTLGGGGGVGSNLLGSFAAGFVGSMVAQSFFSALGGSGEHADAGHGDAAEADGTDGSYEEGSFGDGGLGGDFEI